MQATLGDLMIAEGLELTLDVRQPRTDLILRTTQKDGLASIGPREETSLNPAKYLRVFVNTLLCALQ